MATLKELRVRIRSVRSTQKITSAMKMVAASRLRRAQEQAEAARPYAARMERMLASLAANLRGQANAPPLLVGTGGETTHLLVVATSDRGLAGGFNATILREARRTIRQLEAAGKTVKIFTIGRKGRDSLRRDYARLIVESKTDVGRPKLTFDAAQAIGERLLALFEAGEFDVCTIVYNRFRSAISQIVTKQQLVPFSPPQRAAEPAATAVGGAIYDFEPEETEILARAAAAQPGGADLHRAAGERGERAGRAHDGDGQRHAQRRRHDRAAQHHLQPLASGHDHQGTDRDHLRRRGALMVMELVRTMPPTLTLPLKGRAIAYAHMGFTTETRRARRRRGVGRAKRAILRFSVPSVSPWSILPAQRLGGICDCPALTGGGEYQLRQSSQGGEGGDVPTPAVRRGKNRRNA